MSAQWYPKYVGDYMRDTGHLTLVEHGAYGRLLDYYYASGNPLPPDLPALCRVCCAMTPDEQKAVEKVANEFFAVNGDGLRHNKRADRELLRMAEQHKRLSEGGRKGGLNSVQARLKPGLKHSHKPSSSISTSTSTSTGEQPKPLGESRKRPPKLSDEEWMTQMRATYGAMKIDVAREESKCRAWCTTNVQNFSRGRFLNWLNRASENRGAISAKPQHRQMIPAELIPL